MSTTAPLSFGQQLFHQLDQATPGLIAYNVPRAFRIRGKLAVAALQKAFDALVERHDVLRSVYEADGDHSTQRVIAKASVPFEQVDLSALPGNEREAALARALAERATYHFDLSKDVMLRAALYKLADDEHVVFFLTHHIVSDGWSKSITFDELSELYSAFSTQRASTLAPLSRQFADHARRERGAEDSAEVHEHLAYWREKLAGPRAVLDLPTDRARPTGHTFDGDVREIVLPKSLVDSIRKLSQEQGATLYMVLLAAYQTILHRYSGQDDIITGSPTAGRDAEDTHGLIGYFAGALVMRNSFAGDPTFANLLERVVNTSLDAYEHQDIPFERLVGELQQGEQLTHAPLFQCVLTMEDTIPAVLRLEGATLESMDVGVSTTKFDLTLLFADVPDGLRLRLAFRTALFDGDRIERMLGHLRALLEAVVRDPSIKISELPILSEPERNQLLVEWNSTAVDEGAFTSIAAMFESHAAMTPDRAAAQGEDGVCTYAELNAQANNIAHALIERGVKQGTTVGVCLDRTVAMISALLGVLKAGGAFVPLLPDLPASRLKVQMQESGASVVITNAAHRHLFGDSADVLLLEDLTADGSSAANPAAEISADSTAYVLFTSGSTGVPKGVAVTHANLTHYTRAIALRFALDLNGRDHWHFATVSTLGADLGHTAIFPALASGGTLHVVPAAVSSDPTQFALYTSVNAIDVLKITPNHLRALVGNVAASIAKLPAKWIVLGGEALPWDLALELARAGAGRVLNHYGPTETTVGVCTYEVKADTTRASATVPIGVPLANTSAYVLDAHGQLSPIGVPGELFIGGAGVTRGYIGRDDLTAERFVADRWSGAKNARVYRTGDRVRWLSSGAIEFLGRVDDQVKVRGYRVELGEIEHVLRAHPGVAQCAVLLREAPDVAPRLVAYVVPKQAGYAVAHADRATPQALQDALAAQLPDYMVPQTVVLLEELPLNKNGKLDRAALPPLDGGPADADRFIGPRTTTEEVIASIWADVLKKDRISVTESFLELGGHSLLAIRVLGRISKQLGVRLALRALFDTPTVEEIAAIVDTELEQKRAEQAMAAALAEIENMSDEEVARLLGDAAEPEKH